MNYNGVVIFLLFLNLLTYKKYKNWFNPSSLMLSLWTLILILYESSLVEFNKISDDTYIVICMGIICFILGTFIANKLIFCFDKINNINKKVIYIPRYGWILFLALISILIYLPDAISSIKLLVSGGNFIVLRSKVSETVINNQIVNAFKNYIVQPFVIFLYPMSAYCLITLKENKILKLKKIKKYIFLFSSIIAIMQLFTSGGRASVVYLLAYIIIISQLLKEKIKASKILKFIIGLCILSTIIGVYYISVSRGIDNVGESMIIYLCGCVPLLDYYIKEITITKYYTYGGAFFFGPLNLFFTLLGNIGFDLPKFMDYLLAQLYVEENVIIGPAIKINAFVSWFFYFFKDGGYMALMIEAILYGIIIQEVYKNIVQKLNVRKIIIYSIMTNTILFSMVRFQFISYHYLLAIGFVFVFVKKKIIK